MTADPFHWNAELLGLFIDVIPKLVRGKRQVLLFFRSCGVEVPLLDQLNKHLLRDRDSISKYDIARQVLTHINELGDRGIGYRRHVARAVVDWANFNQSWENDRDAAEAGVYRIRSKINQVDVFTRIENEREREASSRRAKQRETEERLELRRRQVDAVRREFFALFGEQDPYVRGKALEAALNALFALDGVLIREAFTVSTGPEVGVGEQIDGAIELDGHLYIVEMKWHRQPLGKAHVAPHLVRVFGRGGQVRGLIISHSSFTDPAIDDCRVAITSGRPVLLARLEEFVHLLESAVGLRDFLRAKVQAAMLDKNPLHIVTATK